MRLRNWTIPDFRDTVYSSYTLRALFINGVMCFETSAYDHKSGRGIPLIWLTPFDPKKDELIFQYRVFEL